MARKCAYTKEMILEAAIKLFKKEGSDAITAKNIAKELNCSVAPIYSVYLSLDDLKKDLAFEIEKNILEENKIIRHDYINEMIKMIEKHGAYIIIEEGIAIPHAPISENVLKTGISLLIVKEKVLFPNGKGANIFLSFATTNKTEHLGILNDLFELITKYNFIEKISKITEYEELEEYFRKELVC